MKLPERIAWWVLWYIPASIFGLAICGLLVAILYAAGGIWGVAGGVFGFAWMFGLVALFTRYFARLRGDLVDE
tara:strand:- start:24956 stop:25174 length:219 start_codon:yes stop_codon:yes gene_type:complete